MGLALPSSSTELDTRSAVPDASSNDFARRAAEGQRSATVRSPYAAAAARLQTTIGPARWGANSAVSIVTTKP